MACLARIVVSGYPHRVTQRGSRSIHMFHSETDRQWRLRLPERSAGDQDYCQVEAATVEGLGSQDPSKGRPAKQRKRFLTKTSVVSPEFRNSNSTSLPRGKVAFALIRGHAFL